MSPAEELFRRVFGPDRPSIPLEYFEQLPVGYPEAAGEVRRILYRGRWHLIKAYDFEGRLYFSWRRPVLRVKAEVSYA